MSTPTASEPKTKPVRVRRTIIISHEYKITPGVDGYLEVPTIEKAMDLDRSLTMEDLTQAVDSIVEYADNYSVDVKMEVL